MDDDFYSDPEILAGLRKAMTCLPAGERAMVGLRSQGLTFKESAILMGISMSSADVRFRRGLHALKKMIVVDRFGVPRWMDRMRVSTTAAHKGMGDFAFLTKEAKAIQSQLKRKIRRAELKILARSRADTELRRRQEIEGKQWRRWSRMWILAQTRTTVWDGFRVFCSERKAAQITVRLRAMGYERISVGRYQKAGARFPIVGFDLDTRGVFGSRTFIIVTEA